MSGEYSEQNRIVINGKKIKIRNFSKANECKNTEARLELTIEPFVGHFLVEVNPYGITAKIRRYVSVEMSTISGQEKGRKCLKNANLIIFLSVVDINGTQRCPQSFQLEYNTEFEINIPKFLKRSFLLNLADELLPEDVLTIQCELVGHFCFKDAHLVLQEEENYKFQKMIKKLEENIVEYADFCEALSSKFTPKRLSFEIGKIASSAVGIFLTVFSFVPGASYELRLKRNLAIYDTNDEVTQTYFSSIAIFHMHLTLKSTVRKLMNVSSSTLVEKLICCLLRESKGPEFSKDMNKTQIVFKNNEEFSRDINEDDKYAELNTSNGKIESIKSILDFILFQGELYTQANHWWPVLQNRKAFIEKEIFKILIRRILTLIDNSSELKKKLLEALYFENSTDKTNGQRNIIEPMSRDKDDFSFSYLDIAKASQSSEIKNTMMILYDIEEILKYLKEIFSIYHEIFFESQKSRAILAISEIQEPSGNDQTKWNFYIETRDGVIFTIPFGDGKITLGSKLISSSLVFERMLETPMREKHEKSVKLGHTDSDTFINFLYFLQTKEIKAETYSELCDCYKFADKYIVQEMMWLCAEKMRYFLTLANIFEIEKLASLHADKHLTELVEEFRQYLIRIRFSSEIRENDYIHTNATSTDMDAITKEEESYFEFYQ